MADFTAQVFQNEYLAEDSTDAHAVVSVTCSGAGGAGTQGSAAAEILIIDASGSMDMPSAKIAAARRAGTAALEEIVDGTWFAVIAGRTEPEMVYPPHFQLAQMNTETRAAAQAAVGSLKPHGATALGWWISAATKLFEQVPGAQCHAILLTDGRQEGEAPAALDAAIAAAVGRFQCDCRGVGADWEVEQLRRISGALLGSVDIVADPADLEADFEAIIHSAMGRGVADARLRVWAPQGSQVLIVRQVAPTVEDLTPKGVALSPLITEFPTGAWGDESRDYHVAVRVPPAPVGSERLAARVEMVVNDQVVAKSLVRALWSTDANLTTRIDPSVAHYSGQAELADAIQQGMAAKVAGDERTATVLLGKAAKLAHESGNEATTRLLAKVVDVVDVEQGTIRLKANVDRADEMALDTRSTKTTRIRKQEP